MDYKVVKYSEIGKIRSGKRLPKGYTVSEEISDNKYIRVRDINNGSIDSSIVQYISDEAAEKLERYRVKTRDVIISVVGTVGAVAQIEESLNGAYLTENCDNLQVDESICLKDYLKYYLLSEDGSKEIIANTVGSTQPKLPIYGIENFNIKLPSIDNQKRIVRLLNSIDDKIKINNQINNNLRELCKTNYLRLIENNSTELSLSELMDYQGGSQPPASEFQKEKSEDNIRFVQIRDFETDSYVCYIPNSNKNKLCNKDDILIARYGASLGRICYGLSGAYNVALAKVLPKKEEYKELLRVILESDDFYNYINQVGQRSAQAGFNAGDIAGYNVIIPDENGLKEFNSISKNVIEKRLLIIDENRKLSELRDTLLPKLMNGEIDLDNIKI